MNNFPVAYVKINLHALYQCKVATTLANAVAVNGCFEMLFIFSLGLLKFILHTTLLK